MVKEIVRKELISRKMVVVVVVGGGGGRVEIEGKGE